MQTLPLAAWLLPLGGGRRKLWTLEHTRTSMEMLFGEDLHLARVRSLANGVAGVLNASVVSIAAIGRAYAYLAMIESKSGVKQVDRLLSNEEVKLEELMPLWVKQVVGTTSNIVMAMDWTDFGMRCTRPVLDGARRLTQTLVRERERALSSSWAAVPRPAAAGRSGGPARARARRGRDARG